MDCTHTLVITFQKVGPDKSNQTRRLYCKSMRHAQARLDEFSADKSVHRIIRAEVHEHGSSEPIVLRDRPLLCTDH